MSVDETLMSDELTCYSKYPTVGQEKLSIARQMPGGIGGLGIDSAIFVLFEYEILVWGNLSESYRRCTLYF